MKFHEEESAHSRAKYEEWKNREKKADPEKKKTTDKGAADGESKDDKEKSPAPAKEASK